MRSAAGALLLVCTVHATAQSWPALQVRAEVSGLYRPTHITSARDGWGRMFFTEQTGAVRVFLQGQLQETPYLDLTDRVSCCGENGMLSIAFDPSDLAHIYACYVNLDNLIMVSRFDVAPDGQSADAATEVPLLIVASHGDSHYGGQLAFGPDGYLYAGIGDGGAGLDRENPAQSPDTYQGKIVRIGVQADAGPPDIWALGLRNPWRFSFDRQTGDLFIADVGQSGYEEVNYQAAETREAGANYGWNLVEGDVCKGDDCQVTGILPVFEYDHEQGCSIIGGHVYRGERIPELSGAYIFGDYCSGRIWGLRHAASGWESQLLLETAASISTFGEDDAGELYFADNDSGVIYAIEPGAGFPESESL